MDPQNGNPPDLCVEHSAHACIHCCDPSLGDLTRLYTHHSFVLKPSDLQKFGHLTCLELHIIHSRHISSINLNALTYLQTLIVSALKVSFDVKLEHDTLRHLFCSNMSVPQVGINCPQLQTLSVRQSCPIRVLQIPRLNVLELDRVSLSSRDFFNLLAHSTLGLCWIQKVTLDYDSWGTPNTQRTNGGVKSTIVTVHRVRLLEKLEPNGYLSLLFQYKYGDKTERFNPVLVPINTAAGSMRVMDKKLANCDETHAKNSGIVLDDDTLLMIFSYLPVDALLRVRQTNWRLKTLIDSSMLLSAKLNVSIINTTMMSITNAAETETTNTAEAAMPTNTAEAAMPTNTAEAAMPTNTAEATMPTNTAETMMSTNTAIVASGSNSTSLVSFPYVSRFTLLADNNEPTDWWWDYNPYTVHELTIIISQHTTVNRIIDLLAPVASTLTSLTLVDHYSRSKHMNSVWHKTRMIASTITKIQFPVLGSLIFKSNTPSKHSSVHYAMYHTFWSWIVQCCQPTITTLLMDPYIPPCVFFPNSKRMSSLRTLQIAAPYMQILDHCTFPALETLTFIEKTPINERISVDQIKSIAPKLKHLSIHISYLVENQQHGTEQLCRLNLDTLTVRVNSVHRFRLLALSTVRKFSLIITEECGSYFRLNIHLSFPVLTHLVCHNVHLQDWHSTVLPSILQSTTIQHVSFIDVTMSTDDSLTEEHILALYDALPPIPASLQHLEFIRCIDNFCPYLVMWVGGLPRLPAYTMITNLAVDKSTTATKWSINNTFLFKLPGNQYRRKYPHKAILEMRPQTMLDVWSLDDVFELERKINVRRNKTM